MPFQVPETSVLVAAAMGPLCDFTVTPFRNACTLGATSPTAGLMELYSQVFARGIFRGWTGGIYTATYAFPSFIAMGPAYHAYNAVVGVQGAVMLTACTESIIMFGAETCNAQMAKNLKSPGSFKTIHPTYKPFGPGLGIHIARNLLATAGLRIFCTPFTLGIEKVTGKSNHFTALGGDFAGNLLSACMTAPVHQMYAFTVTTPELKDMSGAEKRKRMVRFLQEQYTVVENGKRCLGSTIPRDLCLRAAHVATFYTMYSTLERTVIRLWPK